MYLEKVKTAKFTPIWPSFSKILERIMCNKLYTLRGKYDLLTERQCHFQPGYSTNLSLIWSKFVWFGSIYYLNHLIPKTTYYNVGASLTLRFSAFSSIDELSLLSRYLFAPIMFPDDTKLSLANRNENNESFFCWGKYMFWKNTAWRWDEWFSSAPEVMISTWRRDLPGAMSKNV